MRIFKNKKIKGDNKKFLIVYNLLTGFSERFYKDIADCPDIFSISKNNDQEASYGIATLFEISMYFLFRLDFSLVNFKQKHDTRKGLFLFCADRLKEEFERKLKNNNLDKIIDNRMEGYGEKTRNWDKEMKIEDLHFCLAELIKQSEAENELEIWNFKTGPLIIGGVFREFPLKIGIIGGEKTMMLSFICALKSLFKDNDDFISLELNEIEERLEEGVEEFGKIYKDAFLKK